MKKCSPKPAHLLAGGASSGKIKQLLQKVFADTSAGPKVAYIGCASGDDISFFEKIGAYLSAAGAAKVTLVPLVKGFRAKESKNILKGADVIFLSGGDVEEGTRVLNERNMIPVLRELYLQGKLFSGISAGSIMLGSSWVKWPDDTDGDERAELFACAGIVPVLCDTHAEEDDWEELKTAVRLSGNGTIGYGIHSSGSLWVAPSGEVRSIGHPLSVFKKTNNKVIRVPDIG